MPATTGVTVRFDTVREVEVDLVAESVWRCLGPAPGTRTSLDDEVERALREAAHLGEPRAVLRSHTVVGAARGRVAFDGGIDIVGKALPHLFEGADGAVFALATAGPGIEQRVGELFASGDTVEAFVLDAAGTALAMEALSRTVSEVAADLESAGVKTGPCVVPGNDYWALEGQRAVFRAVPAERIGVRLLDSMLMVPQKSQSAVTPFGEELRIQGDPAASSCRACKAVRCPIRAEPYSGEMVSL